MASLSLQHIEKIYPNGVQAVFDFNLEIKDKEFIVFVGPSGCGKSTTLRMVAGFESISSGRLYIDDVFVNNREPKDRQIAMVFQNYALYPHMSVYDNLKFALELRKVPCPIYEECLEAKPLEEEQKALREEVKKVVKLFTKNQNSKTLLAKYEELYRKIFALEDQIAAMRKPKMGKDEEGIKRLEREILSLKKDIVYAQKKMKGHPELEEKGKRLIEQKEQQIAENQKRIAFLQENDVPLTKLRHLTKVEMDMKINKAAASIDLTRYLFRLPGALSGGQRQRVALGRAIVREPKVFLMDEPLSNLDAKLRVQTRGEISKIHRQVGATTIYVTHDQTEAMTMADRIVCMKDGLIQQIGTPEELYSDPANQFVGGFIGSPAMNFLQGTYEDGKFVFDDGTSFEVGEKNEKILEAYNGKRIVLGIRPENVCLKESDQHPILSAPLSAKKDYYELLGYEYVCYCTIASQKVTMKTTDRAPLEGDGDLPVRFSLDALRFFEVESGNRIRSQGGEQ